MIKNIADLLQKIKEKEELKIFKFHQDNPEFNHPTIIGDIYEGLTHKVLSYAIPTNIDLRIVDGKIKNKHNQLSKQIDCMLVEGEGERIPNTDHFIYPIDRVIAVIEVKKNLYSDDLFDAYNNLNSIIELRKNDEGELTRPIVNMLDIAYRTIVGNLLPNKYELEQKPYEIQSIYNVLLLDSKFPIRIIFGYTGFKNEKGLRDSFTTMIEKNSLELNPNPNKIFAPYRFPNQIICSNHSIIKLNGLPFAKKINSKNIWDVCASTSYNPILLMLEILFTRLTFLYGFSDSLFGDDLDVEICNRLLGCKAVKLNETIFGWYYYCYDADSSKLDNHPLTTSWEPAFLDEHEFNILNIMCKNEIIELDDVDFNQYLSNHNIERNKLISKLVKTGLVGLDNNKLVLLTDGCACAIIPGTTPRFVAGENSTGRLTRWIIKNAKNNNDNIS